MGATTFATVAVGKSAEEAFRAAREHAQYESGHGGYTGTIAEKGDFVLFTLPPRVSIKKFLDWIEDPMASCDLADLREEAAREVRWATEVPRGTAGRAERLRRAKAQANGVERAYDRFWKKVPESVRQQVRQAALVYDDKWGPCVAVQLKRSDERHFNYEIRYVLGSDPDRRKRGTQFFLFCGYASC